MKMLIVDDEKIIRRGIAGGYDWAALGITAVLEARDGTEAMELALKHRPQIIISDICIPKRTGLEFSRAALKEVPDTQIILLSGYDEFQYAREAVQIGAIEYLLKPATIEQIVGAVEKAIANINIKMKKKLIEEQLENYKPVMRDKLLNDLIEGNVSEARLDDYISFNLPRRDLVILVFSIDTFDNFDGWQYQRDYRLLKYGIMNIIDELLTKSHGGAVFDDRREQIVVLFHTEAEPGNQKEAAAAFGRECTDSINASLGVTVTVGISNICRDISRVSVPYQQALQAIRHRIVIGRNKIIRIDDITHIDNNHFYPENIEEKLFAAVDENDKDGAARYIGELLGNFKNSDVYTPDYIRTVCIGLLFILQRKLADLDYAEKNEGNKPAYWSRELSRTETLSEMESFMVKEFRGAIDNIILKLFNGSKGVVLKAKKYIDDNLGGNVSLTAVAGHVYLSNSYFANLFKQEQGETFSDYLSKLKIETAKRLLRNTEFKIYEIAEKIGFDLGYFSQFFKYHTGMAPSDYRNSRSERK
jgi:two-component system response regulator YesN